MKQIAALIQQFLAHPQCAGGASSIEVFCHPDLGPVVEINWDVFLATAVNGAGTTFLWAQDDRIASADTEGFPPGLYDVLTDDRDLSEIHRDVFPRGPRAMHESVEMAFAYYTDLLSE